jgi:hypothetical protein
MPVGILYNSNKYYKQPGKLIAGLMAALVKEWVYVTRSACIVMHGFYK